MLRCYFWCCFLAFSLFFDVVLLFSLCFVVFVWVLFLVLLAVLVLSGSYFVFVSLWFSLLLWFLWCFRFVLDFCVFFFCFWVVLVLFSCDFGVVCVCVRHIFSHKQTNTGKHTPQKPIHANTQTHKHITHRSL